jgi:trypsin-like peptidase
MQKHVSMFGSIPFIADQHDDTPFADLADTSAVDNPSKMLEGWTEDARASDDSRGTRIELEAQVADWNTVPAALLDVLARRRRSVCRIVVPPGRRVDYRDRVQTEGWNGTGFLVGKNLLVTNHHVLNSIENAAVATVEFDYEISPDDLLFARLDANPSITRLQLKPDRLFITSKVAGGLDYTFVWIDDAAAQKFGIVPMERASFTTKRYDPTFLIHHPQGRRKEASLDDTETLRIRSTVIHYAADTDYGSSGAPVFDRSGRLIALHHARNDEAEDTLLDGRKVKVVNEGIKISAIAIDLENRIKRGDSSAGHAREVLELMQGSDTLSSYFGSLGRRIEGKSDVEAVVDAYKGTEQDVDIGFWNIEWLANRYSEPERLEAVARVIADLNLDIWGLVEVSPAAVRAVVSTLQSKFGESYGCAFSEPNAPDARQSTAVIWRQRTVDGRREEWPAEIEKRWHLRSTDLPQREEAIEGKIFDRYPGLFRFVTKSRRMPFDFYLVPLHLKAKDEGSKRRRLASALLADAIHEMIKTGRYDADWVLGGDYNATLASGDLAPLQNANFTPLSAEDESSGAITYLKGPHSLIDSIFLSPNLSQLGGNQNFFIVAKERSIDKYVSRVSDHRPIVMRISLGESAAPSAGDDIQQELAAILGRLSSYPPGRVHDAQTGQPPHGEATTEAAPTFEWRNRTKEQFLADNRDALAQLVAGINAKLRASYGQGFTPLTSQDVWVLTYIEAGIDRAGKVDPDFRHSLGERGLLPLPENIRFWNGPDAPDPNRPMPLEINLHHFYLYLGQLENKVVLTRDGVVLYRDLFRWPLIAGNAVRQAKLLAGVVHGYFYSGNFRDRSVPLRHIMDGYVRDLRVDDILRDTTYVHAGSSILTNRERNIAAALRLHG